MDNAILKSAFSSIVLYLIGLAAGKLGLTPDQVTGLSSAIVTVVTVGGSAVVAVIIAWWKARAHTQAAMIQAVNSADNGVKVVATAAPAPVVNGPLK